jgi:hypothetical protein
MGETLDKQFPVCASLGRLYDPLLPLAKRVRRTLVVREKTVWTDANGYVFATATGGPGSMAPHAIIGVYGKGASLPQIEGALRLALRERARRWIIYWNAELGFAGLDRCVAPSGERSTPDTMHACVDLDQFRRARALRAGRSRLSR